MMHAARLAAELAVCAAYGLRLGVFLTWPTADRDLLIKHYLRG